MTITYQQAKRIRKSSLTGLIADQLQYEKKIGTAVKKAISLKTRGTIMGLTQKFDPLNIAKILTFSTNFKITRRFLILEMAPIMIMYLWEELAVEILTSILMKF
jgi:hypothetical protein